LDGSLDPSFSGDGIQTTHLGTADEGYTALAVQNDQKIVAAGRVYDTRGPQQMALVRYLPNGSLDTSFDGDGKTFNSALTLATSVELQTDQKIVVAGSVGFNPTGRFGVARFNSNGSLDTSFGGTGSVITDFGVGSHYAEDLIIQNDGKIIAAGGGSGYFLLARYNVDGTLDTSFDGDGKVISYVVTNGGTTGSIMEIALQPDGKIVAVGFGAGQGGLVARYNVDGSLDTSFGTSGLVDHPDFFTIAGVGLQSDGKIVVNGGQDWKASRLNTDGSIDATFGGTGTIQVHASGTGMNLLVQPDGKIAMIGTGSGNNKIITARLNPDGTFDTTWGGGAAASASNPMVAGTETTRSDGSNSISTLDAASVQQLLAEPEAKNTWTRKSRFKLFAL
jgi:uncharacterized delta-60 repeat protein